MFASGWFHGRNTLKRIPTTERQGDFFEEENWSKVWRFFVLYNSLNYVANIHLGYFHRADHGPRIQWRHHKIEASIPLGWFSSVTNANEGHSIYLQPMADVGFLNRPETEVSDSISSAEGNCTKKTVGRKIRPTSTNGTATSTSRSMRTTAIWSFLTRFGCRIADISRMNTFSPRIIRRWTLWRKIGSTQLVIWSRKRTENIPFWSWPEVKAETLWTDSVTTWLSDRLWSQTSLSWSLTVSYFFIALFTYTKHCHFRSRSKLYGKSQLQPKRNSLYSRGFGLWTRTLYSQIKARFGTIQVHEHILRVHTYNSQQINCRTYDVVTKEPKYHLALFGGFNE